MIRVTVTLSTGRPTAYDAPEDTVVGDRVVVMLGQEYPKVYEGEVTSLADPYAGPARSILHRCRS